MADPRLFVDADACPVKEETYKVARRYGLKVYVVANAFIQIPAHPKIARVMVEAGPDVADDWIAERIGAADVCVTSDIPLASRCLARGARALAANGKLWTADNIGGALAGRAVAQHMREMGMVTGGPATLTRADRSRFLSALDTVVQAALRAAG